MAELSVNRIAVIRYKNKSVACKDAISFGELILDFETKIMYKVLQKIPANTTLETAIDNESVEVVSAFDENGTYPKMSVGFARDLTPEESDAIVDNTPFIWQTSGGNANIPEKSTAIISKIGGNCNYGQNGELLPFMATSLLSRIYNLYNYADTGKQKQGYKLNSDGSISADSNYTLFWVDVMQGIDNGNNGYVFTPAENKTLSECGFDYVGFQTAEPTQDITSTTILSSGTHGNSTSYLPSSNGWLVFSLLTAQAESVCVHFAWSGYNDNVFNPYDEYRLQMPSQVQNGLYGNGSVYDEVNSNGKYIKRLNVFNSKDANWTEWTEQVYDIETQSYIEQFVGYKTTFIQSLAKVSSDTILTDNTSGLTEWHTDEEGVLKVSAFDQRAEILEQLTTSGVNICYELAVEQESEIQYNGLCDVGDFGDMQFEGVAYFYPMGDVAIPLEPSVVVTKYGANYRDTIRGLANSGVVFNSRGVITSGLFFGKTITTTTLSGNATWNIDDLKNMMKVVLSSSTNSITLPNGGENPFRFQIIVAQDSTGSRALTISGVSGVNVYNPSEFDFSSGSANQICVCTIIWDGTEYIYECTNYIGGE
jgi:hypothetical protein